MTNYIEVHKNRPHPVTGVIQWEHGCPPWLSSRDELFQIQNSIRHWYRPFGYDPIADWLWGNIPAIRIPDTHWAADALKGGWRPWAGGDKAPDDWDEGDVLLRSGALHKAKPWLRWSHGTGAPGADVIGYKPKPAKPEQVSPELVDWPEGLTPSLANRMIPVLHWFASEEGGGMMSGNYDLWQEARAIMADMQPDPLVEALRGKVADPAQFAAGLRDSLAKHGLTITKEVQP